MAENDRDYLDDLRRKAGMQPAKAHRRSYDSDDVRYSVLTETEWCGAFEAAMRNRLIMGAIRYGRIGAPGKKKRDRIASIIHRVRQYADTANQEYLVDAANECMLEFVEPMYFDPRDVYFAAKDDGYHTPELKENDNG